MNGANQLVMKNIINYNGKSPTVEMNDKILFILINWYDFFTKVFEMNDKIL